MSYPNVLAYFKSQHLDQNILTFDVSSATVELAAKAIHCEPRQITKTLSFLIEDQPILIAMAGDAKISNLKYRNTFHTKAKMIPPSLVEQLIGHEVGGVCPFATNPNVKIYLDISLKRFDTVYPAAGSHTTAIKLTLSQLEEHSHATAWVDVCKDWY